MKYIGTRGNINPVPVTEAIKMGMVPGGGLFVPEEITTISLKQFSQWKDLTYKQLASHIFSIFLKDDFPEVEINQICHEAYNSDSFESQDITPIKKLDDQFFILELFHGPTGAFKDIALQVLPRLLTKSLEKLFINKQLLILVATSGDTGKAALEGFKDVPGTHIIVYYPFQKVSKIQELQMLTTEGDNSHVIALKGNFDDCQNAVKQIFSDQNFCQLLEQNGFIFSSANSINWGRLFPQIVYYFYAYLQLLKYNQIQNHEKINIVVPTGNFGNILAAWYAYRMGLPVKKLICASNINNVLTDFFHQGIYDCNRPLVSTISPSMDILVSSNLERFLFEVSERNQGFVHDRMKSLLEEGQFSIDQKMLVKINEIIFAGYASEEETFKAIQEVYHDYRYLIDPHTAVGIKVFREFQDAIHSRNKTIVAATATPFKFNRSVLTALLGKHVDFHKDEFILLQELSQYTEIMPPKIFSDLKNKQVRQQLIYGKDDAEKSIKDIFRIE